MRQTLCPLWLQTTYKQMKKILALLILQIPFLIHAQENFRLKGEITNLKEEKSIYLVHIANSKENIDSTVVKEGKFEFNINLKQPSVAILLLNHSGNVLKDKGPKDLLRFFIEPGTAILKTQDSVFSAKVTGLNILEDHEEFKASTKAIEDKLIDLNKEFVKLSDEKKAKEDVVKDFQERYLGFIADRKIALAQFIKENPQSYISLYSLNADLATDDMNVPQIQSLYEGLSPTLKENPLAAAVRSKIDLAKVTGIGVSATDFEAKTPEGINIKLSSYKGQYVLLDFWASWCRPCRQENPNLVNAYEKFKDKDFTVLGVSIDQNAEAWKKAVKADGLVWTQLIDTTNEIAKTYGIDAIPKNFLIDPSGKIIAKNLRGYALEEKLKEVLIKNN